MVEEIKELLKDPIVRIVLFILVSYILGYGLGTLYSHIQHTFF